MISIRVAAYGVVVDNGRILLAHWNQNGAEGWTLPGGGLEFGEHPVDAAVREIAEETGYTASVDRLLGIDTIAIAAASRFDGSGEPMQALRIIYRASIVGGTLTSERDGSTDEAAWFDVDDLSSVHTVDLVAVGLRLAREAPADGRV